MLTKFEKSLNLALIITEDLEARISQLIGQIDKSEKKWVKAQIWAQKQRIEAGEPGFTTPPDPTDIAARSPLERFKREHNIETSEDIARFLAQWDPSGTESVPKGLYVGWIFKILHEIRLPEDGVRLQNALTMFDKIKTSKRFTGDKEIHKYKSFRDLEKITREFQSQLSQKGEPSNLRAWFKWVELQGREEFFSDSKFTVLRFDPSAFQTKENGRTIITKGVEVIPKKIVIGQHGQEIEASWVPTWADPESTQTKHTVTPTAMGLSRLATGTSYCVASPTTAQTYFNDGPLYPVFKEGELFLLANVTWSEFMDKNDEGFKTGTQGGMGAMTSFFFSKMVLAKYDELGEKAVRNIVAHIKRSFEGGRIQYAEPGSDIKTTPPSIEALPERFRTVIMNAISLVQ